MILDSEKYKKFFLGKLERKPEKNYKEIIIL